MGSKFCHIFSLPKDSKNYTEKTFHVAHVNQLDEFYKIGQEKIGIKQMFKKRYHPISDTIGLGIHYDRNLIGHTFRPIGLIYKKIIVKLE